MSPEYKATKDFIGELEKRSMSTWTDEELHRYSVLTGQDSQAYEGEAEEGDNTYLQEMAEEGTDYLF